MPSSLDLLQDPAYGLAREVRPSQVQMATSVEDVITNGGVYVCEAPVGVGKTLAYLTPILAAQGRRAVIATAKKTLQDQIQLKDLPHLSKVINKAGFPALLGPRGENQIPGAVIKGKGNYACRFLAEKADAGVFPGEYYDWLSRTKTGDQAEYPGDVPKAWSRATAEDCLGTACSYFGQCGYIKSKENATRSRAIVVNHHLLGFDMFYAMGQVGKLVGGAYDILVVDEAHKLAEGVRGAFTLKVAENSILKLVELLDRRARAFHFGTPRALVAPWAAMFRAFKDDVRQRDRKIVDLHRAPVFPIDIREVVAGLGAVIEELTRTVQAYAPDSEAEDFLTVLQSAINSVEDGSVKAELAAIGNAWRQADGFKRGLLQMQGTNVEEHIANNTAIFGGWQGDGDGAQVVISAAPVRVGGIVRSYLSMLKSVVVTSATIAIEGGFEHIVREAVGAEPTKTDILPPAFDYASQGFVYLPKDLPVLKRGDNGYAESVTKRAERAADLIKLSQGGAFVLTTSNEELEQIACHLARTTPFPVFAQDFWRSRDRVRPSVRGLTWGAPQPMLEKFLAAPNSVLVGSKSFWEGIDVQGERLRLVILAKLPFPIVGDPIVKARIEAAGDGWFNDVFVNDMLIDLRQGVGRLIRSKTDRGAVAVLDSRVWKANYGGKVLSALPFPSTNITSNFKVCEQYLPRYVEYFKKMAQTEAHVASP